MIAFVGACLTLFAVLAPVVQSGADWRLNRGASEWTLSGTTTGGERDRGAGCDLWTLRDGVVVKKDSYWKVRTTG